MNESHQISRKAKNMLNVRQPLNVSEHQTINFSRNDLVDTVSALDLNSVFELHGGAKNIDLHNIPSRNRYNEYTSTKGMKTNNMNGGGSVVGAYSSASEGDLSLIKHMIMGRQGQTGGGCGTEGTPATPLSQAQGCGCETGSVLQNGGFNFGQMLAASMLESKPLSNTSTSYNPLNSMTPQTAMNGGYLSELSNSELLSATSSAMYGGSLNTAELSATSSYGMSQGTQQGGNIFSATSPFNMSQQGGSMYSATSPLNMSQQGGSMENSMLSATSPLNMSQQGVSQQGVSQQGGNVFSATSQFNMSQQGGDLSVTSALPIQYDSLFGGKHKHSKKHNEHHKERNSSSSSTSKSGSSSSSFNIDDVNASSSSSKSPSDDDSDIAIARAIARNSTAGDSTVRNSTARESVGMSDTARELARMSDDKDKKRRSRHSLNKSTSSNTSSSSTSTNTSTASTTSIDSSDSGSSISSSSRGTEVIGKVNSMRYNNLLLTSPNSATRSDSLVNAKQFYSSENGDLYSSESNFLRNNISRNRVR
jgi:hypothetical protein